MRLVISSVTCVLSQIVERMKMAGVTAALGRAQNNSEEATIHIALEDSESPIYLFCPLSICCSFNGVLRNLVFPH